MVKKFDVESVKPGRKVIEPYLRVHSWILQNKFSDKSWKMQFDEADTDSNDCVTFKEFKIWLDTPHALPPSGPNSDDEEPKGMEACVLLAVTKLFEGGKSTKSY